jgi:hypothetical protein
MFEVSKNYEKIHDVGEVLFLCKIQLQNQIHLGGVKKEKKISNE